MTAHYRDSGNGQWKTTSSSPIKQVNSERKEEGPMNNNYEVAEIVEIGKAHNVILGSSKDVLIFDDSPEQGYRETPVEEDE